MPRPPVQRYLAVQCCPPLVAAPKKKNSKVSGLSTFTVHYHYSERERGGGGGEREREREREREGL
jgi:hypothetical protein